MTLKTTLRATIVALALLVGMTYTAGPAHAATSWTHNNHYSYSLLKSGPHVYGNTYATAYFWNDTPVTMLCWIDTEWVYDRNYSNYNSPRWFKVQSQRSGQIGYMHSSYVYYQVWTPHC